MRGALHALAASQPARTVLYVTDRFMFPDVNVLVDAAESVFKAWTGAIRGVDRMGITLGTAKRLETRESALQALAEEKLWDLHHLLDSHQIPLGALQARASGLRLTAILHMDPSPQWLVDMLQQHEDARVSDLAQHTSQGKVVTTDRVMDAAVMVLKKRRGVPLEEARLLVRSFVRGVEIVEVEHSLTEAIASGSLDAVAVEVADRAREHLADIDPASPTWSPRPENSTSAPPDGVTHRQFKADNPAVFGVDGEDLYLFDQVRACQDMLDRFHPGAVAVLTTSDFHAAHAASISGMCPSLLYSWTDSGIASEELDSRSFAREVSMSAPQRQHAGQSKRVVTAGVRG